jgi:hypothetical protein
MWFQMLLGHLVGDYLLQNNWMAFNKSRYNKIGWLTAVVHCLLYTFAVCLFMWKFAPLWIVAVFLSHFLIDKFGVAEWYLVHIKGRSLMKYIHAYKNKPKITHFDIIQGGFAAVVYTAVDNTMHLVLMYIAYQLIF